MSDDDSVVDEAVLTLASATRKLIEACERSGGRVLSPGAMVGFSLSAYLAVYRARLDMRKVAQADRSRVEAHLDRIEELLARAGGDPIVFGELLTQEGFAESAVQG